MKTRTLMNRTAISVAAVMTLAAVSTHAAADYASTVLSHNPVGYWRLNETTPVPLADVANNSGSLGAAARGSYVFGAVHGTAGIPGAGTDTAITLPNQNLPASGWSRLRVPWAKELNAGGPFSVEFWAKPAYSGAGVPACPASSVDFVLSPRLGWLFYQTSSTAVSDGDGWMFRIYRTDGTAISVVAPIPNMDTTQWYHVVGLYA